MNSQEMRNRVDELLEELAEIERQQEDTTLSHSDQQLLDQAWEELDSEIDRLEEMIETQYDWGGEEQPISTMTQKEEVDSVGADYYETDFGVYYNAADEI